MVDTPEEATANPSGDPDPAEYSNTSNDPKDWVAGDEPMTPAQAAYLKALSAEAGVDFDPTLSRAAAAELIDQIRAEIPRLAATEGEPEG
jgi:hypothetical protein